MENSQEVERALDHSVSLSSWLIEHQAVECPYSIRNRIAGIFFALSLEHREVALLLTQKGARSSCFALVRSIFEAYMRGLWAAHCATDTELSDFLAGRYEPKLNTIVKKLGQVEGLKDGVFDQIRASGWEALCDYAHGGIRQVSRWVTAEGIFPQHSDEEVIEALRFTDSYGLLACIGIAGLAGADGTSYLEKSIELQSLYAGESQRPKKQTAST